MARLLALIVALTVSAGALAQDLERYSIELIQVVDGDTVDCHILQPFSYDLDFNITVTGVVVLRDQRIRLDGLDAPETRTRDLEEKERGLITKAWLTEQLQRGPIVLEMDPARRGKFGRPLGDLLVNTEPGVWLNLNDEMIRLELAKEYHGGKR